ncbi:hypothetical protein [Oceanisphaera sp. KMM 10153]|uniref:hypothetical protein n=1 Tax=Oceanisphaera submarina TaxID=3390193 RepID=UPI003974CC93
MIDWMLNRLGYYRIVPAQSAGELQSLSQCLGPRLDVLIADARLINATLGLRASAFEHCQNLLLYECQVVWGEQQLVPSANQIMVRLPGSIDDASLGSFMTLIECCYASASRCSPRYQQVINSQAAV